MHMTIAQRDKYTKICLCGYETEGQDFIPCNAQGTEVDANQEPGFEKCPRCGRVFSTSTGEYVNEQLDRPNTEMERKAILLKGIWDRELAKWGGLFLNRYLCRITASALGQFTEKELKQIAQRGLKQAMQTDGRLARKVLDLLIGQAEFTLSRTLVEL